MSQTIPHLFTAFSGYHRIASGSLATVALAVKRAIETGVNGPILIFDNTTGRSIDIDTRGSEQEVLARLLLLPDEASEENVLVKTKGRGRPKLGVVSREITMLPRHWDWLNAQPGGASVVLRKLVDEARRTHGEKDKRRKAHERAYYFMSAMAGDMPNFEEAARALFADNYSRLGELIAEWPEDVRSYALLLTVENDDK